MTRNQDIVQDEDEALMMRSDHHDRHDYLGPQLSDPERYSQVSLDDLSSVIDVVLIAAFITAVHLLRQRSISIAALAHVLSVVFLVFSVGHYIEQHVIGVEGVEDLVRRRPGQREFADWSSAAILSTAAMAILVHRFWHCEATGFDCTVGVTARIHYRCKMTRLRFFLPVFIATVLFVYLCISARLNTLMGGSVLHPRGGGYTLAVLRTPALMSAICVSGCFSVWLFSIFVEAQGDYFPPGHGGAADRGLRTRSCRSYLNKHASRSDGVDSGDSEMSPGWAPHYDETWPDAAPASTRSRGSRLGRQSQPLEYRHQEDDGTVCIQPTGTGDEDFGHGEILRSKPGRHHSLYNRRIDDESWSNWHEGFPRESCARSSSSSLGWTKDAYVPSTPRREQSVRTTNACVAEMDSSRAPPARQESEVAASIRPSNSDQNQATRGAPFLPFSKDGGGNCRKAVVGSWPPLFRETDRGAPWGEGTQENCPSAGSGTVQGGDTWRDAASSARWSSTMSRAAESIKQECSRDFDSNAEPSQRDSDFLLSGSTPVKPANRLKQHLRWTPDRYDETRDNRKRMGSIGSAGVDGWTSSDSSDSERMRDDSPGDGSDDNFDDNGCESDGSSDRSSVEITSSRE